MRQARIKIPAAEGEGVYHCVTRTVNGEWLIDEVAREVLRQQLWRTAEYCGLQVLTYTILSNHVHILVRVPRLQRVTDEELLRRYRVLNPRPTRYQTARLGTLAEGLGRNEPDAVAWRNRQLAQMGDLSPFMKLVKQRFSIWYNATHHRFGTLWAERFRSTLVENSDRVVQTIAAYVDLNCVRAGLVADPKDYRFCAYGEAVAGNQVARQGLCTVMGVAGWTEGQAQYRVLLFGTGTGPRENARTISASALERVMYQRGVLPLATVLRCRIRFFTDGALLGSRVFVTEELAKYQKRTGHDARIRVRALPGWIEGADLNAIRGWRKRPAISFGQPEPTLQS